MAWSELADSRNPGYDNPMNLQDTFDVRIGLEHRFYNNMPLRFGFRRFDSYLDRETGTGERLPMLTDLRVEPLSYILVYIPFRKGHHDYVNPDLHLSVNRNQLSLAGNL